MSDITERLVSPEVAYEDCDEAKAEIETLRRQVELLEGARSVSELRLAVDRDRYRAALEAIIENNRPFDSGGGTVDMNLARAALAGDAVQPSVGRAMDDAEDAERYRWLLKNVSYHDIDHDFEVEHRNVPVLAQVSNRLWYHATDDVQSNTLSDMLDLAMIRSSSPTTEGQAK
jgi:hypothetical protein